MHPTPAEAATELGADQHQKRSLATRILSRIERMTTPSVWVLVWSLWCVVIGVALGPVLAFVFR